MRDDIRILWVVESNSGLPAQSDMVLTFGFSDAIPEAPTRSMLPSECRAVKATFRNHRLNRIFAIKVLKENPDAVYVRGLYGGTLDLLRVARLLGARTCLELLEPLHRDALDPRTANACDAVLQNVDVIVNAEFLVGWPSMREGRVKNRQEAVDRLSECVPRDGYAKIRLDYALYEFCLRDHPLLYEMQRSCVSHFQGCENVLDLACGAGIFLELLADEGIAARGVERNPEIAGYARGMGFDVETSDAVDYLRNHAGEFDGIYCSHFVEHLPFETVQSLMGLLAEALRDGGVLVLVFPDPESIRSQLLGFWRDPEHVRFYHPELIELLAMSHGLECEWSSQRAHSHEVISFPEKPPEFETTQLRNFSPEGAVEPQQKVSHYEHFLWKLGFATRARLLQIDQVLTEARRDLALLKSAAMAQQRAVEALRERTSVLWQINQTWAWDDNAVLRLRKPARKT